MNIGLYFISLVMIGSAALQRITEGQAHPILVYGAIAGVFYLGIEIHNLYFFRGKKR